MRYSIGIPTFRRPRDLKNAISSVLAQTVSDFELIICDNDSGDETESVVKGFNDSRIRYFKNETNIGGPRNMAQCAERASGEWFIMVSDDDALYPEYLSYLDESLRKYPDVCVMSTAYHYGKAMKGVLGKTLHYCAGPWLEMEGSLEQSVCISGKDLILSMLFEAPIMHPVTAVKRSTLLKAGGYFIDFMYGSDLITFARVAIDGNVAFDFRVGGWYHSHESNWSRLISTTTQLNTRRKLNDILLNEFLVRDLDFKRRAARLLKLIPRKQKWKFLEEAMTGGYPEIQKQLLIDSIGEERSDLHAMIRLRAWLKMNKKVALKRWWQSLCGGGVE